MFMELHFLMFLIVKLDQRLAAKKAEKESIGFQRKERIAGLPSTWQAPIGAPQWAVSAGNKEHKLCYKLSMITVFNIARIRAARVSDFDIPCNVGVSHPRKFITKASRTR